MRKHVLTITVLIATVMLLTIDFADDIPQWRSERHDVNNELSTGVEVTIDGNLDEWADVKDSVTGTNGELAFLWYEFENIGAFQSHGGGTWSGADDHSTCFMIAWNPDTLYLALEVTDDEFEHGDGNPWDR